MPVLEQITDQLSDASGKLHDAAESANDRAHKFTKDVVVRIQEGDVPFAERFSSVEVPFADRLSKIDVPLVDRLPEPTEAVDAYFGFWASGITSSANFTTKVLNRLSSGADELADATDEAEAAAETATKKATTKKTPAKKTTAKKA